jgi:basic membrane lipoprotein Med (substrate-binding protein (PBP1-ABC) superfamily)
MSGFAGKSFSRRALLGLAAAALATLGLAAPAAAQKTKPIKVAAIYTVPVEQQWVGRIHQALNAAKERGDVEYVFSENVANTDYERVMREYAEAGNDLIIGEVFGVERAARQVAEAYPDTAFLMGSSFGPSQPNFSVFDNFIHEPSYLTGMIAGKATKSNIIGMVGGYAIPEVNRLMNAFMEGALSTNPDVKFSVTFIGSWYDPPKAKEAAFAMIDAGADVLYAERFGVSDAAKERGVKAIGNVIDTAADYPGTILASALWHMEPTIDRAIAAVLEGKFEPADYGQYSYMAYGGGSFVVDETIADKEAVEAAKAKEKEIKDGLFRVNVNDAEPKPTL